MHTYLNEYPNAGKDRENEAKSLFPYKTTSPQLYAAKNAHKWACFSFGDYIYLDKELNNWIHTLDDIIFIPDELDKVRKKYLTQKEIARIISSTHAV